MNTLEHLQHAVDYIEGHLEDFLSLEMIAEQAGYSPYYFHHLFSSLAGIGVMDYVRKRRLTHAGTLLIKEQGKVIDLAVCFGYETSEAFSKAFKKQHHYTPSEIRRQEGSLQTTFPLNFKKMIKGAEIMKMRIVETPALNIAGYQKTFCYEDGSNLREIPQFWNEINADQRDLELFRRNDQKIKGVVGLCQQGDDGMMTYLIGTSCDPQPDLVNVEMAKSRWLVFDAVGPLPQAVQDTWAKIVREFLPTCEYEIDESVDLEVYSDDDPCDDSLVTEIWLKIKE